MAKIKYIEFKGKEHVVDLDAGMTLMEGAIKNMIPGVDADCGGACSCSTCHLYIAEEWIEKVGRAEDMEGDMLDFAYDVRENSRLGCQVEVTDDMDGLIIYLPERQF